MRKQNRQDCLDFCYLIQMKMAENPDWVPDIFQAVVAGSTASIQNLKNKIGMYRNAVTSALALSTGRTSRSPDIKKACEQQILEVLRGDTNACPLDKDYLSKIILETMSEKEIAVMLTKKHLQESE